jgi:hypothetical protein
MNRPEFSPTARRELLDELERTGRQLRERARALAAASSDPHLRGVVISDDEFDQLLLRPLGASPLTPLPSEFASSLADGHWSWFVQQFGLLPHEQQMLLICLLPEVDVGYERIFGYLQDNVTARRPTVDLLLQLIAPSMPERLALRRAFWPEGALIRPGLLQLQAAEDGAGLAGRRVAVNPLVVEHLLAPDAPPQPAHSGLRLHDMAATPELAAQPDVLPSELAALPPQRLWVQLEAHYADLAHQTAAALCESWGLPLLTLDVAEGEQPEEAARTAALEARLRGAALFVTGLGGDRPSVVHRELADRVARELADFTGPVCWHCALQVPLAAPAGVRTAAWRLPPPDHAQRLACWQASVPDSASCAADALETAAARYRLSPTQIAWASRAAADAAAIRGSDDASVAFADLAAAARRASSRDIGQLAHRQEPRHGWHDLVLPADRIAQLREMCDQLSYRHVVMEQWCYGRKTGAPGLSALFAGPSGTGKTMAAEVVAAELALDLYKIDLSGVVSKYIGETEKNLERIFELARDSNAILLFDEADALFGKRSETRDAHDRYANIEVSYLLQKIEEYDGLVILTSNLRQNLDEAFMRRLQLSVDFPFPDEQARVAIWRQLITPQTPVGALDLEALAKRYRLSGGSIRNVIITAAYLAARDGASLDNEYVIWAIRREYQKLGRLVEAGQFGDTERLAQPAAQRGWSDA